MNALVRFSGVGILAGGLCLAGCAGTARGVRRPAGAALPATTTAPATLPAIPETPTSAPAIVPTTRVAVEEPAVAAALPASQPTTLPTLVPAPATAPVAVAEPAESVVPTTLPANRPAATAPAPIATLQAAIDAGLRRMLDGQPAFSPELVARLTPADQQFVKLALESLDAFHARLATDRSAATAALVDMAIRLRPAQALQIPTVSLCSRVEGFGAYDTVEAQQLAAFRDSGVVLYCEVQGFSSRRQDLNWETRLLQQVSLLDAQGQVLWRDEPNTIVDLCRRVRRDFYIARIIRLPANLPEGHYTLRVALEDQLTGQKAQTDLPLSGR